MSNSGISRAKKKELAQILFTQSDMGIGDICQKVGVTDKTLKNWREAGSWDALRAARTTTRDGIIGKLHQQILLLIEKADTEKRILTTKEVDSIAKMTASIEKLDKNVTLAQIIQVFTDFNNWMVGADPQLAKIINQKQDLFVNLKAGGVV